MATDSIINAVNSQGAVFGVVEHFERTPPGQTKALKDMEYLKDLPCQIYRIDFRWEEIEKERGTYLFEKNDWYVEKIKTVGGCSKVLGMIAYEPEWIKPFIDVNDVPKIKKWEEFIKRVIERYKGKVNYWEIWNEPEEFWFRREFGNNDIERDVPILYKVIVTASQIIRNVDPTAKILLPGFSPEVLKKNSVPYQMLERLFQMGVEKYIDAVTAHNYPFWDPPNIPALSEKEDIKVSLTDWVNMDKRADMKNLIELLKQYKIDKPIWITEFGGHNSDRNERAHALCLLRTVAICLFQGVEGMLYYEFYDYPHDEHPPSFYLMKHRNHYKTLSFRAYQEIIKILTGTTPDHLALEQIKLPDDIECRIFKRDKNRILCFWSNSPKEVVFEVKLNSELTELQEISFSPIGPFIERKSCLLNIMGQCNVLTVNLKPLEFKIFHTYPCHKAGVL
ncbi:cellulase family glycosylhydrolase [Candidatus Calescamantes bacterium]|nr:cellulase family glycosylhydrolase [Candidatus Calescamantes bacterium]